MMDAVVDGILIVSILGVFVLGYFLMTRLDTFLDESRKTMEKKDETREPSCVMLTEEMSEEEIVEEVRRFREKHENTRIVLYDSADTDVSENTEYRTEQKKVE